jgi:hypothetical protein
MAKAKARKKYTNTGVRSTEFKVNTATQRRYTIVSPPKLWISVQAKAKGKISVRALILGLLQRWIDGDIEHPKPIDPVTGLPADEIMPGNANIN